MNRLTRIIPYNHLTDYNPKTITELLKEVQHQKANIINEALTLYLGLCVTSKDTGLISIAYDGFHYVYYAHIRLGYLRTIFNDDNITLEFNYLQ